MQSSTECGPTGSSGKFMTRIGTLSADDLAIGESIIAVDHHRIAPNSLEPISKSPEEDNEASELYEAEEVLGVVFPTDEDAALPLNPSKEALHEPASHIAA